ncbi:hypothetical protein E2C01_055924 [Portunus trituberculatus]|uniref:Uncharacterized protein n=1 Tax=Portunus trituberculatus TaxID=210409 RepID=A0A5B7GXG4_PORTR|nr:hypothetical protein [Portunus trituberculatus]
MSKLVMLLATRDSRGPAPGPPEHVLAGVTHLPTTTPLPATTPTAPSHPAHFPPLDSVCEARVNQCVNSDAVRRVTRY